MLQFTQSIGVTFFLLPLQQHPPTTDSLSLEDSVALSLRRVNKSLTHTHTLTHIHTHTHTQVRLEEHESTDQWSLRYFPHSDFQMMLAMTTNLPE